MMMNFELYKKTKIVYNIINLLNFHFACNDNGDVIAGLLEHGDGAVVVCVNQAVTVYLNM